ncbi:MAG: hypothetical protein BAA01_11790 [Bacillus thermozeamaize]|uniref:Tyr recombinase domain-containing protein n=1 Tax=Bacillus thermozeamaize TaxID=230954 RepID=A0A1Y3PQU7_9BACI|nr:MAG: hypothetical protein BAA01_11790 [Bacillus thermozeamaize]
MAYIRRRGCKCPKDAKRCTCGAKWSFTVDIGVDPVTGKRKQYTKSGFDTRRDAELAAAKVEAEVASGTFVRETRVTFEEYAELWLKTYRMSGHKPSSVRLREFQVQVLLRYFAKLPLPSISRKRYRETVLDLCSKMERKTVREIHGVARAIFRMAVQDGDLKTDPTEHVKIPTDSEETELPKYMEKEQLREFLRLAKYRGLPGDYPFFLLLAYTGMRIGEACALKWADVNRQERTISINGTLWNPNDISTQYEILPPKTKKSRRTIEVDPIVFAALDEWKAKQNEVKMLHRKTYHDGDFVFGRIDAAYGYPPKIRTMELRMDRLTQWMNLPYRLTPHSLRHTHVSLLAEAGVSLEAIMDRIGHSDGKVTRQVYLHVTKQMKSDAAQKFSALMSDVVKL